MKITEKSILFTGKSFRCTQTPIYKGFIKGSLEAGFCIEDPSNSEYYLFTSIFPQNKGENPRTVNAIPKQALLLSDTVFKSKVFTQEELDFLMAYDEVETLDLNFLVDLCKGMDLSTFVLSDTTFMHILDDIYSFKKKYKYNSTVASPTHKELSPEFEYIYTISIQDMGSVFTDVYKQGLQGICMSLEIINITNIEQGKRPFAVTSYLLFTNNYEGIFYRDGVSNVLPEGVDTSYIGPYIKHYNKYKKLMPKMTSIAAAPAPKMPMFDKKQYTVKLKNSDATRAVPKAFSIASTQVEVPKLATAQITTFGTTLLTVEPPEEFTHIPISYINDFDNNGRLNHAEEYVGFDDYTAEDTMYAEDGVTIVSPEDNYIGTIGKVEEKKDISIILDGFISDKIAQYEEELSVPKKKKVSRANSLSNTAVYWTKSNSSHTDSIKAAKYASLYGGTTNRKSY